MVLRRLLSVALLPLLASCASWENDPLVISLNGKTEVMLHVASRASYTARHWSSVGFSAECSVNDENVIRLVNTRLVYLHPENMKAGRLPSGGDEARKIFHFEAVSKGEAVITFRKLFRGELQETTEVKITVRE